MVEIKTRGLVPFIRWLDYNGCFVFEKMFEATQVQETQNHVCDQLVPPHSQDQLQTSRSIETEVELSTYLHITISCVVLRTCGHSEIL